jgi:hypothetical protein
MLPIPTLHTPINCNSALQLPNPRPAVSCFPRRRPSARPASPSSSAPPTVPQDLIHVSSVLVPDIVIHVSSVPLCIHTARVAWDAIPQRPWQRQSADHPPFCHRYLTCALAPSLAALVSRAHWMVSALWLVLPRCYLLGQEPARAVRKDPILILCHSMLPSCLFGR